MSAIMGDSVASPTVWIITIVDRRCCCRPARHRPPPARAVDGRGAAGTWPSSSALAVLFGAAGSSPSRTAVTHPGAEFFAGWLTEYSLSVDNLFIFIIIMSKFAVPRQYQQTALMIGIVLALVMRGIFIAVGAAAINQFSWVFYIFGAFLIYTA